MTQAPTTCLAVPMSFNGRNPLPIVPQVAVTETSTCVPAVTVETLIALLDVSVMETV